MPPTDERPPILRLTWSMVGDISSLSNSCSPQSSLRSRSYCACTARAERPSRTMSIVPSAPFWKSKWPTGMPAISTDS